jgi:hypothetical protein
LSLIEKIFNNLNKILNNSKAFIRKDGDKSKPYCVYSEQSGKNFGCYSTREGAEERLKEIKMFKHIKK